MLDNKEVDNKPTEQKKPGIIRRVWQWWRRPSRLALGTLLLLGFAAGYYFLGRLQYRDGNGQHREILY